MQSRETKLPHLLDQIEKLPPSTAILGGLFMASIVGLIDSLTGSDVSLSFFYLLPILLVTWALGERAGLAISLACAAISYFAAFVSGIPGPQQIIFLWNTAVRAAIFLVVAMLLANMREHLQNERKLARTDFLTGALNNRAFYEATRIEVDRARRYNRPLSVAYIDLDNFKEINDEFGHSIGDAVLRTVAKTITANVRSVDILARIGGDEFALLLPETGMEAEGILRRLHAVMTEELDKGSWNTSISMGATTFLSPPNHVDEIIHMADKTMYKVKRGSKSGVAFSVYEEE